MIGSGSASGWPNDSVNIYNPNGSIIFRHGSTANMTLTTSNLVGIGDSSPDYLLELHDATNTPAFALSDDDIAHGVTTVAETDAFLHLSSISTTVGGAYLQGLADASGTALQLRGIQSSDPTDTVPAISLIAAKASGTGIVDLAAAETVFQIANNDDTAALTILGDGSIAFPAEAGANANDYVCIATSTGAISSKATACTGSSSLRYKKNIEDLPLGLTAVLQMRPVSFDWREEYIINPNAPRQIGFIAEEMERISPLFVTYQDGQIEGVEYMKLTAVMAKAIQELDLKINPLTSLDIEQKGSLATLIRDYLENTLNGLREIFVGEVHTEKLCVGETCVTEEQLQELLRNQNVSVSEPTITTPPSSNEGTPPPQGGEELSFPSSEGGVPAESEGGGESEDQDDSDHSVAEVGAPLLDEGGEGGGNSEQVVEEDKPAVENSEAESEEVNSPQEETESTPESSSEFEPAP